MNCTRLPQKDAQVNGGLARAVHQCPRSGASVTGSAQGTSTLRLEETEASKSKIK